MKIDVRHLSRPHHAQVMHINPLRCSSRIDDFDDPLKSCLVRLIHQPPDGDAHQCIAGEQNVQRHADGNQWVEKVDAGQSHKQQPGDNPKTRP